MMQTIAITRFEVSYRVAAVFGGAALTWLAAMVKVPLPFTPVPVSMQPVAVLLMGALMGRHLGGFSQLLYLMLGLSGLPVFAKAGTGLAFFTSPTCGYLLGFAVAAFALGKLFDKGHNYSTFDVSWRILVGYVIIYAFGLTYLWALLQKPFAQILILGFWPFLPGAVVKYILTISMVKTLLRPAHKIFS